jgi:hypothetical protein
MVAEEPHRVTPWFAMEWNRLRNDYRDQIASLSAAPLRQVA